MTTPNNSVEEQINRILQFVGFAVEKDTEFGETYQEYEWQRSELNKLFRQALHQQRNDIVAKLEGMKIKPSIHSLSFDDCANCGQKVNRDWVDNKTVEIKKEAISQAIQTIKEMEQE